MDTYRAGDIFILATALVKMRKFMKDCFGVDIFHYFLLILMLPYFSYDAA